MEYTLVTVEMNSPHGDPMPATAIEIMRQVNAHIRDGWRPQGGVCQYRASYWTAFFNGETMEDSEVTTEGFIQAMVRD